MWWDGFRWALETDTQRNRDEKIIHYLQFSDWCRNCNYTGKWASRYQWQLWSAKSYRLCRNGRRLLSDDLRGKVKFPNRYSRWEIWQSCFSDTTAKPNFRWDSCWAPLGSHQELEMLIMLFTERNIAKISDWWRRINLSPIFVYWQWE